MPRPSIETSNRFMFNSPEPSLQWWVPPQPHVTHVPAAAPSLAAQNVRLRALTTTDMLPLRRLLVRQSHTDGTIDTPHHLTPAATRSWLRTRMKSPRETDLQWAISPLGTDRLIGYLALHDLDLEQAQAELSFRLDSRLCRAGDATEAGQVMLAFAFSMLELKQVCAFSEPESPSSSALLASFGLRPVTLGLGNPEDWTECPGVQIWSITRSRWMRELKN